VKIIDVLLSHITFLYDIMSVYGIISLSLFFFFFLKIIIIFNVLSCFLKRENKNKKEKVSLNKRNVSVFCHWKSCQLVHFLFKYKLLIFQHGNGYIKLII
jgi:hypothetical protein